MSIDIAHPGGSAAALKAALIAASGMREPLIADRSYYVATTGSDTTGAGSIGSPWATLQHASNVIQETLDIAGFTITIHVADGNYAGVAWQGYTGSGNVAWLGNNTTPASVVITDSTAPSGNYGSFICLNNSSITCWISGFKMAPTIGPCVDNDGMLRAHIIFGEPTFILPSKNIFAGCQSNGHVIVGNFFDQTLDISTIDGTAISAKSPATFVFIVNQGGIYLYGPNYNITGTLTVSRAFAVAASAALASVYGAISGTCNGKRFEASFQGQINADTLTSWPGNAPGIVLPSGTLTIGYPSKGLAGVGVPTMQIDYQVPITGFSYSALDLTGALILNPAGTLATGTVTMPPNPLNGQLFDIKSTMTITALTLTPAAGQSVVGSPGTIALGDTIEAIYRAADSTWYC